MHQTHILHLETATEQCSVALSAGTELLGSISVSDGFKHNENLMGFVQDLVRKTGANLKDLQAIAVSAGPGSYTGLRIGVSSAKGLCYALGIPLIAIDTLQIMAIDAAKKATSDINCYLPMIDARRMEVYAACYDTAFQQFAFRSPKVMDAEQAAEIAQLLEGRNVLFFGNGAGKLVELFQPYPHLTYLDNVVPQAEAMIVPAFKAFQEKQFCDLAYFEPEYLKPFYTTHPAGKGI